MICFSPAGKEEGTAQFTVPSQNSSDLTQGQHFWLSLSGEYPEPNAVFGPATSSVPSVLAGAGDLVWNGPIRDEYWYGWPITAQYSPCTGWPPGTASWAAQRSQPDPRVSALPPAANTHNYFWYNSSFKIFLLQTEQLTKIYIPKISIWFFGKMIRLSVRTFKRLIFSSHISNILKTLQMLKVTLIQMSISVSACSEYILLSGSSTSQAPAIFHSVTEI